MSSNPNNLRINGERLLNRLTEMAQIGETPKGGVSRVALTDEDKAGRDLFAKWCQEAECTLMVDQIGNIFAHRAGTHDDLPPVIACSHLDSQPTGGRFDGVYGVLAGLEVIEALNDEGILTNRPLEVVSWTSEEGARFAPAMIGSGVFAGVFDLDYGLARADKDGLTIGEELQRIGYTSDAPVGSRPIRAAFELHIEQGPILEAEEKTIGVVSGVQGLRWYDLVIEGQEAHAGPTPMEHRRDPVVGLLGVLQETYALAEKNTPHARLTFGDIKAEPGSRNTVPGRIALALDLRHPDPQVLDSMDQDLRLIVEDECRAAGLVGKVKEIWHMPPVSFAPECISAVKEAADKLSLSSMDIVSGAGHDALYLSKVMPTGMIFIPCEGGLSHNERENANPEDLISGCNVLLQAILEIAES
jgi:N-carbamoyl-L-amino-acid hydrolase